METTDISRDKLISDMKVVIADADELLRATAGQAGEKVAAARARIQDSLDGARIKLAQFGDASAEKPKAAPRAADDYVHEHPWHAVGIAALLGLVLGTLVSRR